MALPLLLGAGAARARINQSLRCRAANGAHLTRTQVTPTSRRAFTFSAWLKRGADFGSVAVRALFHLGDDNNTFTGLTTDNSGPDRLWFQVYSGGGYQSQFTTSQVLRDPTAWYHIVLAIDTTQATASNRVRLYINGAEITSFASPGASYPAQNLDLPGFASGLNSALMRYLGTTNYLDGYLAQVCFVDGQQLTPAAFGQTDPASGAWVHRPYAGTFGANGSYLPFDNAASATTIAQDRSGNGNNWTASGISVTAGATFDQMLDTPTNSFCTLNPLFNPGAGSPSYSEGNLFVNFPGAGVGGAVGSIAIAAGDFYWEAECLLAAAANGFGVGVALTTGMPGGGGGWQESAGFWGYDSRSGQKFNANVGAAYGASFTAGDIIGVRFNRTTGELSFSKNGVAQGVAYTGLTSGLYVPAFADATAVASKSYRVNFGQRAFVYAPLGGAVALNTANLVSAAVTLSGSFTGNAGADGPFIWANGNPVTLTINGNAVTFGTHADRTAGGFKLRTSSASYNASGTNTWTATAGNRFRGVNGVPNNAQGNP